MTSPHKPLEEAAKRLSECADVMPKTLAEHQNRVYNACLDMIYLFETKLSEAKEAGKEEAKIRLVDDLFTFMSSMTPQIGLPHHITALELHIFAKEQGIPIFPKVDY